MTDRFADLDDDADVTESDVAESAALDGGPSDVVGPAGAEAPPSPPTTRWARHRERRRTRVSKWDRPPQPKDWRYFVGTFGKVLIATGILMFGVVAYQLWGAGIETARDCVRAFLSTPFEGGRHQRRVDMLGRPAAFDEE